MPGDHLLQEDLIRRLPLPLAQLYRRAHNAKTTLERHLAAFYLWEAALKLLGCSALAVYAARPGHDPSLVERLQNLARPALGHWWEFVRLLVPTLADAGDPGFQTVRDLVLGKSRNDLPRLAGLDAVLLEVLEGKTGARTTVRLTELFDRLVRYRNREIGHGASGQKGTAFYERMERALLAGMPQLLEHLDVLAGRRLVFVADVRLHPSGCWLVERYELKGENASRIGSLELPDREAIQQLRPLPKRVYLDGGSLGPDSAGRPGPLVSVHPLLVHDLEADETFFLNARRGKALIELLSYKSGRSVDRADLAAAQQELLSRLLQLPVGAEEVLAWSEQSQAEEGPQPEGPPAQRRLGEFELLSELGRGGMGVVYRAWQPSLGRQVALKVLFRSGDPRAEARFAREIRALGKVEHPNVVKVFASGSDGDQWFYAMELVEGASLDRVCARLSGGSTRPDTVDAMLWHETVQSVCAEARKEEKPLDGPAAQDPSPQPPPRNEEGEPDSRRDGGVVAVRTGRGYVRQVVEVVRQVAEAAHALHERGIIHRDVKPGNILISPEGKPVLMDLGLAQLADEVEGRLTKTRQFVGTLRYASPEQVLAAGKLDRRADVYSLGATLWELLTLRPLFDATEQTPTPALMNRIQVEEPASPRKYHRGLSRDLEAICLRCLEKDAKKRYATAGELARDLERFLEGEPVRARPVRSWERGWKWARRRPLAAALAAATVLLVLGLVAGVVGLFYHGEVRTARLKAESALGEAQTAKEKAEKAQTEEEKQRKIADSAKRKAEQEAERAEKQRELAETLTYLSRVQAAHFAWQGGDVPAAFDYLGRCDLGPRGWEYDYVCRLCNGGKRTLNGHTGRVTCVAFSLDGKRIVSGGGVDKTVKVWDADKGSESFTLKGHTHTVTSVAFSPDGKRIVSASIDKTVKVWDADKGTEVLTLKGHTSIVMSVAFSPDGKRIVSASYDNTVKVWDADKGTEVLTLNGHKDTVYCVAMSVDGKRIVSASGDKTVKVWDADKGSEVLSLKGHSGGVSSVAFSPNGKRIVSASQDETLKVWDCNTGQELLTLRGHRGIVTSVAFSSDGNRIVSGSKDMLVKVWDPITGQEILSLKGHKDAVYCVAMSVDGKRIVSGSEDAKVKVWDAETGQETLICRGHNSFVNCVAFSFDDKRIASGSEDAKVKVWNTATGQEIMCLTGHTAPVTCVAFSGDGKHIASGSEDATVKIWDTVTGKETRTLKGHTNAVRAVKFSPVSKRLVSGGDDQLLKVWGIDKDQEILTLNGHTDGVTSLVFSPNGKQLVSGSWDMMVKVWHIEAGQELRLLQGHTAGVTSVAISADGKRIISGSKDRTVKVWDAEKAQQVFSLEGHKNLVSSVAISTDGKRIISGSWDMTVKVWHAETGQEALTLKGHTDKSSSVAISADGKRIVSSSHDNTVKIWDATDQ